MLIIFIILIKFLILIIVIFGGIFFVRNTESRVGILIQDFINQWLLISF